MTVAETNLILIWGVRRSFPFLILWRHVHHLSQKPHITHQIKLNTDRILEELIGSMKRQASLTKFFGRAAEPQQKKKKKKLEKAEG